MSSVVEELSSTAALRAMEKLLADMQRVTITFIVFRGYKEKRVIKEMKLKEILSLLCHQPKERLDKLLDFKIDFRCECIEFKPRLTGWVGNDRRVQQIAEHRKKMKSHFMKKYFDEVKKRAAEELV